jgi:uncharacterized membrane protein YdjX (TVP38/TMEM64 family)
MRHDPGTDTITLSGRAGGAPPAWKRLLPLAVVAVLAVAVFGLGLDKYLSFEQLRLHRGTLMAFVASMPVKAALLFILAYAAATSLSLPGGAVLTLTGGFLFGMWVGTGLVVVGATLGATILFLVARSTLGAVLRDKAGPWLQRMEAGFKEDAFNYLLTLRLIPGFPFFVVNLVPAFLGVPLRTYIAATALGIIPGTFVFASIGAGLGSIFDSMQEFSLRGALTPQVLTAMIGLAVLSLAPVAWKRLKARKAG